jgi:hypothetical protein
MMVGKVAWVAYEPLHARICQGADTFNREWVPKPPKPLKPLRICGRKAAETLELC